MDRRLPIIMLIAIVAIIALLSFLNTGPSEETKPSVQEEKERRQNATSRREANPAEPLVSRDSTRRESGESETEPAKEDFPVDKLVPPTDRDSGLSASLREPKRLTHSGGLTSPMWSPDGKHILVTTTNYSGLYILTEQGTLACLTDAPLAGYRPQWSPDGKVIIHRCVNDPTNPCGQFHNRLEDGYTEDHWHAIALDGSPVNIESLKNERERNGFTFQRDDNVYMVMGGSAIRLTSGDDKYYDPIISPDGKKVLFEGISTGVWIADTDGSNRKNIGRGNNANWSPDGRSIIFDISEDDGYALTAGDVYFADAATGEVARLTDSQEIESRPAWSPDGTRIAFERDGDIYVAPVSVE